MKFIAAAVNVPLISITGERGEESARPRFAVLMAPRVCEFSDERVSIFHIVFAKKKEGKHKSIKNVTMR